jgi:hypothetical protein
VLHCIVIVNNNIRFLTDNNDVTMSTIMLATPDTDIAFSVSSESYYETMLWAFKRTKANVILVL